ncbi:hypothetical protein GC163_11170 [bacterium]|nr:hypothetical protein [bacterium]
MLIRQPIVPPREFEPGRRRWGLFRALEQWLLRHAKTLSVLLSLLIFSACLSLWIWAASVTKTWPRAGSPVGLLIGIAATMVAAFEICLVIRKRMRVRQLGGLIPNAEIFKVKYWMLLHLWLGIITFPLSWMHIGFRWDWGAPFSWPWWLMWTMFVINVSGVWGLCMQTYLPRRMRNTVAVEVPAVEIEPTCAKHAAEYCRQLDWEMKVSRDALETRLQELRQFYREIAEPFVLRRFRRSALVSEGGAMQAFRRLRRDLQSRPAGNEPLLLNLVDQLEELCSLRRQLEVQRRLHFWLHNWIWVHLGLTWFLVSLLTIHILTALRYL